MIQLYKLQTQDCLIVCIPDWTIDCPCGGKHEEQNAFGQHCMDRRRRCRVINCWHFAALRGYIVSSKFACLYSNGVSRQKPRSLPSFCQCSSRPILIFSKWPIMFCIDECDTSVLDNESATLLRRPVALFTSTWDAWHGQGALVSISCVMVVQLYINKIPASGRRWTSNIAIKKNESTGHAAYWTGGIV